MTFDDNYYYITTIALKLYDGRIVLTWSGVYVPERRFPFRGSVTMPTFGGQGIQEDNYKHRHANT